MKKKYLSYNDIEGYCNKIIRDMLNDNWKPDYIVGITRGGLLPAVLISQYTSIPMFTLDVSLRDNKDNIIGPESNSWMAEDAISNKNILIVDDINDTGATIKWICNDWKEGCRSESPQWNNVFGYNVRTAFIVQNESSSFKDVNYCGFEINKSIEDVWVDFPWEEFWSTREE